MYFLILFSVAMTLHHTCAVTIPPFTDVASLKRSPVEIDSEIDALIKRGESDLNSRAVDTYLAPEKSYDLSNVVTPDLDYSHPFIAASTFTVTGALSFSSLVTGCIGVGSANPIASYSCASSIAVTSISFLSALYHTYKGFRDIRATLRNNNVSIGLRHVKRGLDSGEVTMSHDEYMQWIMHTAGLNGTYVGHNQRDGVEYHTPVYQFMNPEGHQYHLSISADENGEIRHTLSFAQDTTMLEKRQGYEGVRVNGGLDLDACQRKQGTQSTNPSSGRSAYSYLLKDFQCLVGRNALLNSNYVQSDLMDTSGNTVLTMGMSPYKSGRRDYVKQRAVCSNTRFYFSQSCIN